MAGPNGIKISEIKAYLDTFGGFKAEYFVDTILNLDNEYMNWLSKRQEKTDKIEEQKNKRSTRSVGKRGK